MKSTIFGLLLLTPLFLLGCDGGGGNEGGAPADNGGETTSTAAATQQTLPTFTVEWSEYPSWSAIDVAGLLGIINPKEGGEHSEIESRNGVDIVLKRRDYIQSMTEFGAGECDAVTVTNIDSLNLAKGRPCTATLPTSTSAGADGILALGAKTLEELKGTTVYGPEDCVTEYLWIRALELANQNPDDYQFANMDPDAAAVALQDSKDGDKVQAAGLWQPFLMTAQRQRPDANLVVDSTVIPLEIIDLVLVGNDSPQKEAGSKALAEAYYELNKRLADPATSDMITERIGKKFSNLPLADMQEVLTKCKFFKTAAEAHALFSDSKWQETMSTTVVKTSVKAGIVKESELPSIGFNDENAQLNFSTEYLVIEEGGGQVE